jgi:hypothetical protein
MPKELGVMFTGLVGSVNKNRKKYRYPQVVMEINEAIGKYKKERIDYLMAGITAMVSYYEVTKPQERIFSVLSWKNINILEEEISDEDQDLTIESQRFCDFIIKEIIGEQK